MVFVSSRDYEIISKTLLARKVGIGIKCIGLQLLVAPFVNPSLLSDDATFNMFEIVGTLTTS